MQHFGAGFATDRLSKRFAPSRLLRMGDDRIAELTPQQLACLRKAAEFKGSKIIAQEMGITSKTVDRHIQDANRTLGVGSRPQAIRLLLEHDRRHGGLSPDGIFRIDPADPSTQFSHREIGSERVRDSEDRTPYDPHPIRLNAHHSQKRGAATDDLITQLKTVVMVTAIAAVLVTLIGQYKAVISAAELVAATVKSQVSTR